MSKHNKDNKPQERFIRLLNEYGQVVVFGGSWNSTSYSGSRASSWYDAPSDSNDIISARGACYHRIVK